jgi:hypothetical protein
MVDTLHICLLLVRVTLRVTRSGPGSCACVWESLSVQEHTCASEFPVACFGVCLMHYGCLLLVCVAGACEGLLQPLRVIRPVNGGPGWDMDVVMQLRALNCDLSGGAAE